MEDPDDHTQKDAERSGHIIRYNFIADTRGCTVPDLAPGGNAEGIYLDNFTSNCFVYGNIIVRSGGEGGIWLNGGKNNIIENNIVVNSPRPFGTGSPDFYAPQIAGFLTGNRVCRNIFYRSQSGKPWFALGSWTNRVLGESDYNLFFNADGGEHTISIDKAIPLSEWQKMGYDVHSVIADPLFVDPEHNDYRLKLESPALKLGFQPIDVTKIGIRR